MDKLSTDKYKIPVSSTPKNQRGLIQRAFWSVNYRLKALEELITTRFKGDKGDTGADGADGADGNTVLNGSGAPSTSLGINGDFYIDITAVRIYGPKTSSGWGSGTSLIGGL